jgi:hypothetical protein
VELLLDMPLSRGERCLVEYDVEYPQDGVEEAMWDLNWGFGSSAGLREYCITMRFPPSALPRRVVQFWQPPEADEMRDIAEVPLAGTGTAQFIAFDLPPGFVGLRWEY